MSHDAFRQHLVELLKSENAHTGFSKAVQELRKDQRGQLPDGASHTAWQLVEHLRIAQWDILEFSRNAEHESPEWPDGYWPPTDTPPTDAAWEESIEAFRRDRNAMCELVGDPETDLLAEIPWGDGQTLLREALLLADHNSYHIGQLVSLRRALRSWPPEDFDYGW